MLAVLLLILKILGIVLLSILGLVLLILLVLLFVPIRYKGNVVKDDNFHADGWASWLLHIVHLNFKYDGDGFNYVLKLFGKQIKPEKEKPKKKSKKAKKKSEKKSSEKKSSDEKDSDKKDTKTGTDNKDKPDNTVTNSSTSCCEAKNEESAHFTESVPMDSVENNSESVTDMTQVESVSDINDSESDSVETNTSESASADTNSIESNVTATNNSDASTVPTLTSDSDIKDKKDDRKSDSKNGSKKKKSKSLFNKKKSSNKQKKTKNRKEKKDKTNIAQKLEKLYNKFVRIKAMIEDEKVIKCVKLLKKELFKLLRILLPRKIKGNAKYGFEDPAITGYITAVLGAMYGKLARSFTICPDFENAIFECSIEGKGHFTLFGILIILLRVILDRNFKYTKKLLEREKEGEENG